MNKSAVLRIPCIFFIVLMLLPCMVSHAEPVHSRGEIHADTLYSAAVSAADYIKTVNSIPKNGILFNAIFLKAADSKESVRYLSAFSAFDFNDDYDAYGAVLKDIVLKKYRFTDKLSSDKVAAWHTISLGLMACGINPNDIPTEYSQNKIDLVKDGVWAREKAKPLEKDGVEGLITGLIVLDGTDTIIPSVEDVTNTRESIITKILSAQNEDGSFSSGTGLSVPEVTAFAVTALAPYKNLDTLFTYKSYDSKTEMTSTAGGAVGRALSYLSSVRSEEGDYSYFGIDNIKITSSVITMLTCLGLNPVSDERFITNGKNLMEILLSMQNPDGSFSESSKENDKTEDTSYAIEALAAHYRFLNNKTSIFNFTDRLNQQNTRSLLTPNVKEAAEKYYSFNNALVSSDDYEEIIILIDRAKNSYAADDNKIYIGMLEDISEKLYSTREIIKNLNYQCKELLLPQTVLGTKNLYEISVITKKYKALDEADKIKVTDYEAVIEKKNSLNSRTSIIYIFILIVCILAVALIIFLAVFLVRSSPLLDYFIMHFSNSNQIMNDDFFDDEDYEEDDDSEYLDTNYDAPLPYEDDDEFFDYVHDDDEDDNFRIF